MAKSAVLTAPREEIEEPQQEVLQKQGDKRPLGGFTPKAPLAGMLVYAYDVHRGGLDKPAPAIITRVLKPGEVAINVWYDPREGSQPSMVPVSAAAFCRTTEEFEHQLAQGRKWVCHAYNPVDPQPYQVPPPKAAPRTILPHHPDQDPT